MTNDSGACACECNAIYVAADTGLSFDGTRTGASSCTKTGAGELGLRCANSRTGDIRVNAGTLTITSDAQLGASTARGYASGRGEVLVGGRGC